jgi:hypothetical protein
VVSVKSIVALEGVIELIASAFLVDVKLMLLGRGCPGGALFTLPDKRRRACG